MKAYAVLDPRSGHVVASYDGATDQAVRSAVDAASAAHLPWAALDLDDRAHVVRRVGELHAEHAEALGQIISREMGKPLAEAVGEAEFSASIYEYYADNAERLLADEPLPLSSGGGSAVIRRSSIGPLVGIMPWNYPYYQVARFAAPNLVLGNTILLKHASQCPESAAEIARLFQEAGAPNGVYVNVFASPEQIAEVIADPRVRGVSLTGSEKAGAAVAEVAGRHLKKVVLELGGSDPFILLSTDDLDATVDAAVATRLENTGQACNGGKRFIVLEPLYDDFVERFTAKLISSWSGAPLSSPRAFETLADQVDRAVAQGAIFRTSGERSGCHFPPGVLTGVTPDNDIYREELFGPVAVVHSASDEETAIAVANDTQFGLGSYVFSTDDAQVVRVSSALETGMVFVNGVGLEGPELPFGGTKQSGFGRELGHLGIDEFANKKLIRNIAGPSRADRAAEASQGQAHGV